MRRILCVTGIVAATLFAASNTANASMIMKLTEGSHVLTCDDITFTCTGSGASGTLVAADATHLAVFQGVIGDFSVSFSTATSNIPGSATGATLDLGTTTVTNTTSAAHMLTIDVSAFGYTSPGAPGSQMGLNASASESSQTLGAGGGSITAQAFVDPLNSTAWATAEPSCTMAVLTSNNCNEAPATWTRSTVSPTFSLRELMTFNLTGNQSVNTTASVVASLPEPASLLLLGSGLIAVARSARRRRSKAATA